MEKTEARYKLKIEVFFPQPEAVQNMVNEKGINLFYESIENRQTCCGVRKVEPLNRALQNTDVWITGLRAEQNDHRKSVSMVEWLEDKKMYKINPLLNWTYEEMIAYIKQNNVPYNSLHDKGFISIGCAPCTRAIEPGEDARAGRWWWEASHKECDKKSCVVRQHPFEKEVVWTVDNILQNQKHGVQNTTSEPTIA